MSTADIPMPRKPSLRQSFKQAKKVYSSSKAIQRKETLAKIVYKSINHSDRPTTSLKNRVQSCHDKAIHPPRSMKKYDLPIVKNVECDSTAEDLMERISKRLSQEQSTRNSIKSFLVSRARKNSRIQTEQKNEQQENPLKNSQSTSTNMQTKRRIFQCKIIKSSKIPFALLKKKSENSNAYGLMLFETDKISEIAKQSTQDFISPQSQQLIDFL